MTRTAKYIVVNQTPNYLCEDILSAISRNRPNLDLELWHGLPVKSQLCLPGSTEQRTGPGYDTANLFTRFCSWIRFTHWVYKKTRDHQGTNTRFLFFSNPPTLIFLRSIKSLSFDYAIYDLYPESLQRLSIARFVQPITNTWKRQNAWVFRRARRVFVISEHMAAQVRLYLSPADHLKVKVIPLWAERSIHPDNLGLTSQVKKHLGFGGKHIILYAGNIGESQPVQAFTRIALQLAPWHDWILVIVGKGSHAAIVQRRLRAFSNVAFRSEVTLDELSNLLSIADWGLVLLSEASAGTSVPSKAYNLLAAGVPLLAMVPEENETARLIDEDRVGLRFSWLDMPQVLNKVTSMPRADHGAFSQRALEMSKRYTAALAEEFVPPLPEDEVQP